jgi:hypothetical protein
MPCFGKQTVAALVWILLIAAPIVVQSRRPSEQIVKRAHASVSLKPRQEPQTRRILEVATSFWAAKTLLSAVELGVFTELGQGPAPLASLQQRLNLHARAARDFLDALVALGFLAREGNVYSNAPEAAEFLDRAQPTYIGGLLEMCNDRLYQNWGRLTDALRSGEPQVGASERRDPFDALYSSAESLRSFLSAMTGISRPLARAIARKFPWQRYTTMFDIGTAQGCLPVEIALAHPHITGGGMDLAKVGPLFNDFVRENGLSDRLRFVQGDMFEDPWPSAQVFTLGHILHDWGLERKQALVRRAYEALPPGGALLVYDAMIDDDRRHNVFGLLMSLNMLLETHDGFDYTPTQYRGWLADAGFTNIRSESLPGNETMMVGTK